MGSSSTTTASPVWRSHYGGAGGYTPEPNGVLEATMVAAELDAKRRALAWVVRYSTGNHSDVVTVNGREVGVVHCAASIGVTKGTASKVLAQLEDEGDVAFQGRSIYRIYRGCCCDRCDSLRKLASEHTEERRKVSNVGNNSPFVLLRDKRFKSFLDSSWKEAHPNEAAELEAAEQAKLEAEQIIERKLQLALEEFRRLQPADEQPPQSVPTPPPSPGPTPDRLAEVRALVDPVARQLRDTPSDALIATIERNLQGAPVEWLAERIAERKQALRKLGLVAHLAEDVGRAWGSESLIRAAEEARRKQQEAAQHTEYIAALADAITEGEEALLEAATAEDLEAARELLHKRNAPVIRRPTESETRVSDANGNGHGSGALPGRNGSDRRGAVSSRRG